MSLWFLYCEPPTLQPIYISIWSDESGCPFSFLGETQRGWFLLRAVRTSNITIICCLLQFFCKAKHFWKFYWRSKLYTYDDVVERLARHIGLDDPTKLRLTSHNCYSQQPKPQPIKYRGVEHLSDMLAHYNQVGHFSYLKDIFFLHHSKQLSTF